MDIGLVDSAVWNRNKAVLYGGDLETSPHGEGSLVEVANACISYMCVHIYRGTMVHRYLYIAVL